MSHNVRNDPKRLTTSASPGLSPPPPRYSEIISHRDSKGKEPPNYSHPPWLLRRTSIHVESTPANFSDDTASEHTTISSGTRNDERRTTRHLLSKVGRKHTEDATGRDDASSIADSKMSEHTLYGTTVSIEASQPRTMISKQREMKGLEDAASMKRWSGTAQPGEAWGKLIRDPELWDPNGDTLVYYGYQRPQASFRIQSALLEATHSDMLISKLQDGLQRNPKAAATGPTINSPFNSPRSSHLPDMRNLRIDSKSQSPTSPSSGFPLSGGETQIRYQIHFPPPDDASKTDILRYHLTTRNFFALLMDKPLVGLTFYQALVDLHQRLQTYLPNDTNCAQIVIDSFRITNLHNISNDPAAAAGLLAWSEERDVCWREGYREAFVHCCGMFKGLQQLPEKRDLSKLSYQLLERSHAELQLRLQYAEDRLSTFDFDDMWVSTEFQLHHSRAIFDQFRRFLQQWYSKLHKRWPPKSQESDTHWLTRPLVAQLQKDFGALYDYHVDRAVVWANRIEHEEAYPNIVLANTGESVENNRIDVCLARLFTRFDQKRRFAPIPHPFPLLPAAKITTSGSKPSKPRFFTSRTKSYEKGIVNAYLEASNSRTLPPAITKQPLLEAFLRFEKTDELKDSDTRDARRARWILLYGVLQVLAGLAVDTPGLAFTEEVNYFLSPKMRGTPPWERRTERVFEEANVRDSYCWKGAECWGGG